MTGFAGFPFHRLPVANPGEVSAHAGATVDAIARGLTLEPEANKAATLAASATAQIIFAVLKRHRLTETEARAAVGLAVSTLAAQGVFDQGKEG